MTTSSMSKSMHKLQMSKSPMLVLLAVGVLVVATHARQAAFTLEALMSVPFTSEIAAAPAGGHVAWVQNAKGARNVWVATAPDFKARQLTRYGGDDGQDITTLTWAADGATLLYVRGGAANRQGEIPNPTSHAEGAEQAIWVVTLAGGDPKKLADGSAPAVSSTGRVAYVAGGKVWATTLSGSDKPAQLFTARGQSRDLKWSPDGRALAFVSGRGDHGFIGVYEPATKSLRWLDASVDLDANPAWSPDGARIAFTRTPATKENFSFAPRREGEPWSIRVADVATGRGAELWKAERGPGSIFQGINGESQLLWVGDRIVFPWEREGWINLYAVPASAGSQSARAVRLTPGAFEVEHVALERSGPPSRGPGRILYSSNQDDIDRRHLWSVSATGGGAIALTTGNGLEWMPAPASDGSVAFIRSTARDGAHAAILPPGGRPRALAPETVPQEFPAAQLVDPQQVVFAAADGVPIHGQLFLPRDLKPGERRPAVLFFHGGSRRQMLLGWHYMSYYHNTYALNQYLASRGYLVLSVNYRSGTGYGLNFREALNYGATGASEFNDVLGAGLYMKARPDVDPQRIGLWGGSYGGFLTAHGLARASDLFAAGVDIHGVHDWNVGIRTFIPAYAPSAEIERRNFNSSPMAYISGWRSPVLLIHGDDDRNVSFSETVTLVEALRKQNVTFETLVFPDEVHGFLRHENWLRAFAATSDFFDRYLKGKRTTSND
jgi:dipeptidyl aminopeptidase/acylaminoacyl peptidase